MHTHTHADTCWHTYKTIQSVFLSVSLSLFFSMPPPFLCLCTPYVSISLSISHFLYFPFCLSLPRPFFMPSWLSFSLSDSLSPTLSLFSFHPPSFPPCKNFILNLLKKKYKQYFENHELLILPPPTPKKKRPDILAYSEWRRAEIATVAELPRLMEWKRKISCNSWAAAVRSSSPIASM